jgi:hypothetical protein
MSGDVEFVLAAERAVLDPAVRSSAADLDRLLDPDFSEIGASGAVWTRDEAITALLAERGADAVVISDMSARHVTADVILVTYATETSAVVARRASWWRRDGEHWRCYFHQGTPSTVPVRGSADARR